MSKSHQWLRTDCHAYEVFRHTVHIDPWMTAHERFAMKASGAMFVKGDVLLFLTRAIELFLLSIMSRSSSLRSRILPL